VTQPLGSLLSDREFQDRLDTMVPRSPAKQFAMRQLRRRMDRDGRVNLAGGVRGWAKALHCSLSRPRQMLEEMAAEGLIALDILREPGGWVAQLTILAAFAAPDDRSVGPDRSSNAPPAPEPLISAPHQDAENAEPDRSGDRSPPTPPHVVHDSDSEQQQQHGPHTVSNELTAQGPPPDAGETWLRDLWRTNAYQEFPRAERAAIDFLLADRRNDPMAVWRWLQAEPAMTLDRARRQFVNAATREFDRPRGAAIRAGQYAGEIAPGQRRRVPERGERAANGHTAPAPTPDPAPPPEPSAVRPPPDAPHLVDAPPPVPPPRADPATRRFQEAADWALLQLRQAATRQERDAWLHQLRIVADAPDVAVLVARDELHRVVLEKHYAARIGREMRGLLGPLLRVRVVVAGETLAAAAD
jgi:hypothetical protein